MDDDLPQIGLAFDAHGDRSMAGDCRGEPDVEILGQVLQTEAVAFFLAETGEASQTWLAVSLSTWTSLLAFGLLALSRTPVLHHFGVTVAIGLGLVWLLSPTMRATRAGEKN